MLLHFITLIFKFIFFLIQFSQTYIQLLLISFQNSIEVVAEFVVKFIFLEDAPGYLQLSISFHFFKIKFADSLLVFFLLSQPKKLLIKLCKYLFNASLSRIFLIFLSHHNSFIDNCHDKKRIFLFVKHDLFFNFSILFSIFIRNIIPNFGSTRIYEIVLIVINTIDLMYNLPHALGAARCRSHGVTIR